MTEANVLFLLTSTETHHVEITKGLRHVFLCCPKFLIGLSNACIPSGASKTHQVPADTMCFVLWSDRNLHYCLFEINLFTVHVKLVLHVLGTFESWNSLYGHDTLTNRAMSWQILNFLEAELQTAKPLGLRQTTRQVDMIHCVVCVSASVTARRPPPMGCWACC